MTRQINETGLAAIKQWEGLRLWAYKDAAGIWTIGYGHTSAAGSPQVRAGMTVTAKRAEEILLQDIRQYEQAVNRAVKVAINDNQFAALVSFCYNVGIAAFEKSTLLKKLNNGNYDAVPKELMKWVNSAGRHIQGLVNRRAAEAGLWAKGEFVASGYMAASPNKENPLVKPETVGPIAGAVAGSCSILSGNGPVQWAFAIVMVISCLIGAWYFIHRMKREAS